MKKIMLALALTAATLVSATPADARNATELRDGRQTVMQIGYDPIDSMGIPWNANIQGGNYVAVAGQYPESATAWAEWDPRAPVTPAIAVDGAGREYRGYALFVGYINCSTAPVLFVIIEGIREPGADVKVLLLSRRADVAWTLSGGDPTQALDARQFRRNAQYRRSFVAANGTALSGALPATNIFREAIASWDRYAVRNRGEQLITPFSEEQVTYIAGHNPQYGFGERLVANSSLSLSPDLISTGVGLVFDLFRSAFADSRGFDHRSEMSRAEMGANMVRWNTLRSSGMAQCVQAQPSTLAQGR
jgi:hypothetical protein